MKEPYSLATLASVLLALAGPFTHPRSAAAELLPADRQTAWNPGLPGGIPGRATVCATVSPPAGDATATIQAAINACPAGQVVRLTSGTFTINNDIVYLNKGITLRGAGAKATLLQRTNGAKPGSYIPNAAKPVIIVGPSRWASTGTSYNLAADGAKGATSVRLATAPASFSPGQIVLVDELSNASWQTDPLGRGQIWASPDFRVVYQRHNPSQSFDDPFPAAAGWFSRQDRPTAEVKEVARFDPATKTLTFTTPLHISYRAAQSAQVYVFAAVDTHVKYAGVEDLKVTGGDDGQIRFERAAYSWAARIDNTAWLGEGFAVNYSFRVELRDSYVHTPVWMEPGGGSYNISLAHGSSEVLIENNISTDANKVMVARSAGAGSVVGYNYMDDGHIGSSPRWVEIGLNASHMVGPHHVLFEGNWGFNFDSDHTHGNSVYLTVFRNWLTGKRSHLSDDLPKRAAGVLGFGYWMSFIGNVLGYPGMQGWVYETGSLGTPAIFMLGWDEFSPHPTDPRVKQTVLREGNFDYVTNSVKWDTAAQTLPASLYKTAKPAFFGSNTWPWVDPLGSTKLYTLPAKARYDAGQPVPPPVNPTTDSTYTLTVTKTGTGSGTVTSSPAGISCGTDCSQAYASGTVVTLNAVPPSGSTFTGWSGSCSGSGACQVTMNAARSVGAAFAVQGGTAPSDFNGDGQPDLVWRNGTTGANSVWHMSGATRVGSTALPPNSDVNWQIVAVADFNADGRPDLLWRHRTTGATLVWFMNGTTRTSTATLPTVTDVKWQIAGATDFDGDGWTDILWRNQSSGANTVWLMAGTTRVATISLPVDPDTRWQIAGTADFNGDGKPDILWRNQATGDVTVWYMNGTTRLSTRLVAAATNLNWQLAAIMDLDRNGRRDIVWRDRKSGAMFGWILYGISVMRGVPLPGLTDLQWQIVGPR
jgi:hypothetical protein